jgi:hypothetical protein
LPESEGKTPETSRITTTSEDPIMEMGRNQNGFHIFLKSMRFLEEVKKNTHIKIPPKSLYTNFRSLAKILNPLKFKKIKSIIKLPLDYGPTCTRAGATLPNFHLHHRRAHPPQAAFTPLCAWLTGGPHQSSTSSGFARAHPRRHRFPLPPVVAAAPLDTLRCCLCAFTLPRHQSLSLTPL